ncbi:hypothetical protein [Haloplanus aerogenes]|uniref:Uncharacterized protein n=1 Tax=Haloplanus aerogenes TaxID=660522 RepID=A0A3M0CY21_9EURY|nr:hypothetical protein [Haloplanus aerogenes]AZH26906.1 hypothetical protein DU502_16655 [Haloplanus aerogenes]RMB12559.1 hypothetical protein ATH50_3224 [Haloplanus aerogenes]
MLVSLEVLGPREGPRSMKQLVVPIKIIFFSYPVLVLFESVRIAKMIFAFEVDTCYELEGFSTVQTRRFFASHHYSVRGN